MYEGNPWYESVCFLMTGVKESQHLARRVHLTTSVLVYTSVTAKAFERLLSGIHVT